MEPKDKTKVVMSSSNYKLFPYKGYNNKSFFFVFQCLKQFDWLFGGK